MTKKINYYAFLAIVAYIPFYRFFQALLESHTSLSSSADFWVAHWYEPVISILLLMNLFIWLFIDKKKSLSREQILAIALLLFGAISILFLSKSIGRGVEGFRFLLLPLAIYLSVTFINLEQYKTKFIKTYLSIAVAMAVWSIAERFFPANYLVGWGILSSQDSWYGTQTVVGVKQGVALLGGPNLLAAYLLPSTFIFASKIKKSSTFKLSTAHLLLFIVVLIAFALTFSRSALVGLVVAFLTAGFLALKNWKERIIMTMAVFILGLSLLFIYRSGSQKIRDLFTHGASQTSHQSSLQISLDELSRRAKNDRKELILGNGLGSAGPSALKYGDGIISESWYLQVLLELGIAGFALWLAFFWLALKKLWQKGERSLFFVLLSILIMTAFLHTLSDNPAISFTIFALVALFKEGNHEREN